MHYHIRRATVWDAGTIARVHAESWRTTYQGILPAHVVSAKGARRYGEFWQQYAQTQHDIKALFVAEAHDNIVGFASVNTARDAQLNIDAEVTTLYVLQQHHRRGVGRALLSAVARHVVQRGVFSLYLWALKSNPSRLFYDSVGGELIAEKDESIGGFAIKEVAYGWADLSALIEAPTASRTR